MNDQIACLNKTRCHYRWPCRLFMKFLVWAAYSAYIIMDSYRPHSRAGHCFHTFHMSVDELCQRLLHSSQPPRSPGPAVRPPSFAGCGTTPPERHQQQPLRGLLHQVQQVSKETPGHRICKYAHKQRKTTFWCSTCHKYLCLRVGSTCWSDYHTSSVMALSRAQSYHLTGLEPPQISPCLG